MFCALEGAWHGGHLFPLAASRGSQDKSLGAAAPTHLPTARSLGMFRFPNLDF